MNLSITISLILCLVVYAMQVVIPCKGSCGVDYRVSNVSCCAGEVESCCCKSSCCETLSKEGCHCSVDKSDHEHLAELSELLSVHSSITIHERDGRLMKSITTRSAEGPPPNKAPPPLSGKEIRVFNESFRL